MKSLHPIRNKYIFLAVSFIFWFSHFIYIPILSPYIEFKGGQYAFIGLVLGSYGLMQFLFRLPMGVFSDLVKVRKPFIIFGMLVSALSCLAFALTDSLGWILLSRSLAGVAASAWVVFTVLYSSYFTDQHIHRAMGSISFVVVLAQFLGMSVSGFIVDTWGWAAPFWIGGMIGICGALLSLFVSDSTGGIQREPVKIKELASVIREPMLLKVSLLSILAHGIIFTTMFGFIPTYALHIGLKASEVGFIVFSFMIPHAAATLLSGSWFVPRVGQWKTLQIAFGATAFFTLMIPLIETKAFLCVVLGLNGFSMGLLFPLFLGMAIESISREKRATAMGLYQAIYAIGMFAVPLLAGILNSSIGIAAGFYFSGLLAMIAFFLIVVWNQNSSESKEGGSGAKLMQ
ncbi:MFS transporter [Peribacillus simplex]|uniref:MFS transporter n=1 Tax=Peribacillus simplex TaxID=1478 RepID=UPI000BA5E489|nr:MFS transporter [Peribacillus simplex]PAL02441.1 MFS transporter [Peribacillus simplex]